MHIYKYIQYIHMMCSFLYIYTYNMHFFSAGVKFIPVLPTYRYTRQQEKLEEAEELEILTCIRASRTRMCGVFEHL